MAIFKYFIKVSVVNKNKPANIRIRFFRGKTFNCYAQSGKSILPDYWNYEKEEARKVAKFAEGEQLNKDLKKLKNFIEGEENKVWDKSTLNTDWLKTTIDKFYYPEKYEEKKLTLFEFIEKFIQDSKSRLNENTGQNISRSTLLKYGTCYNYLKSFSKQQKRKIDFKDIDLDFYNDFVKFLKEREKVTKLKNGEIKREKGLATNTIGKQIAVLKVFINAAIDADITNITAHNKKRFKILSEETDSIYLNEDELKKLYELDLTSNPKLDKVRDLFLVGCWTGCRFSDVKQITPEKIQDGFIKLEQIKTQNEVLIPLHPVVISVLEKYGNNLPRVITNQRMNEYLKVIGRLAEFNSPFFKTSTIGGIKRTTKYKKWELLSTHTARRSFATNLYKGDFPTISIMQITGHKTEKAFLKYIKVTSDEHAKKLREFWQKKGEHLKVV
jgi:integrase